MVKDRKRFRNSLVARLLACVGTILIVSLSLWAFFNIRYIKDRAMRDRIDSVDQLGTTIRLGLHYAMMLNSRDDIQQIILNIARQNDIMGIRIFNKAGEIKFANHIEEIDRQTNIKDEACYICHRTDPPATSASRDDRIRLFHGADGVRLLGVISPVFNEPGCATADCHVHPADKKVLGALDLVVSLADMDRGIARHQRQMALLAITIFLVTAAMIIYIIFRFVTVPIGKLIRGARRIEKGDYASPVDVDQNDEMGQLAKAINQMGGSIGQQAVALNQQRDEYQTLFETVPCIITVQDNSYRLIGYNREFAEKFAPQPGDFCYRAYKGRDAKCVDCPVEKTFADGGSHYSEESGLDKQGNVKHWIVRTSPIRDADGKIVAAMEMNLDITARKLLEEKLAHSEKKYHAIFSNIPNPVFVLDPDTLEILDCNASVANVYGYEYGQLIGRRFPELFWSPPGQAVLAQLKSTSVINQVKHRRRDGKLVYVTIRVSPSEYGGQQVQLVTIGDITKRLEAEQQLIQASKMATLGEMATGVAHELNQPLSVIKTASNFFMRKVRQGEPIKDDIMATMAGEIDSHVERAARIIGHMRQFGRKTDPDLEPVQINDVARQAFEIFSQQLKVRGIDVAWDIDETLPPVMGDAGRLEQVMINLLINARDAIEEHWQGAPEDQSVRQIRIASGRVDGHVQISVCDTGGGIDEAIRDKIFEPFFTTKKVGQGTGLGLSISYGIIQECNGSIRAVNRAEGGACFVVRFPALREQP